MKYILEFDSTNEQDVYDYKLAGQAVNMNLLIGAIRDELRQMDKYFTKGNGYTQKQATTLRKKFLEMVQEYKVDMDL